MKKGINGYFNSLDCSSGSTNSKMFIAYLLFPLEWIEKHDVEQKLVGCAYWVWQ